MESSLGSTPADIATASVVASPHSTRQGLTMKALTIPPAAVRDEDAVEMMRAWIAERGLHCALNVGMYESQGPGVETRAWGIMLADAAQHVADALAASGVGDRDALLDQIIESFSNELDDPSSRRKGQFT